MTAQQHLPPAAASKRTFDALLRPRSVAILGCSGNPERVNGRPLRYFLEQGFQGRLYPVNPRHEQIGGLRCYPDVASIPDEIDLAIIALPASKVLDGVRELVARKVPAAVIFSSGFGETGTAGEALQRELLDIARSGGLRFVGPNCVGVLNSFDGVAATFSEYLEGETPSGPVGFVSQSGAFGTGIAALARLRGIGLGMYINTGNEADISFGDAVVAVAEDPRIRVVACYAEGIRDGRGLIRAAHRAMELGKPVIMTKVGRTESGARAAVSHTGALAGSDAVLEGVLQQAGIIRTDDEEEMLDLVEMLGNTPLPRGNRLGVVSQSGGAGVLISDRAEQLGLEIAALGEATRTRLRDVLPGYASVQNPVDVTGQSLAEPGIMQDAMEAVLADPGVDIGVLWLRLMDNYVDEMVRIIDHVRRSSEKPFVVSWLAAPQAAVSALRERGICVTRGGVPAIEAIAGMVRVARAQDRWRAEQEASRAIEPPVIELPQGSGPLPALQACALLDAAGIVPLPCELAATPDEAVLAARRLGHPVAVKIESADLPHKTEVDGVALGLGDDDAVRTAAEAIIASARQHAPSARIDGVLVQKMAPPGVELVIGARQDPAFGPVVMVGLGGVLVEVLRDAAFAAAPVSEAQAERMLASLRGAALLDGVRGAPPVDRAALCTLISRVSRLAEATGPDLAELDLNPVIAGPEGVAVADWLLVRGDPAQSG